ncbi:hypothetical protein ACWIUD_06850 [Helicobacter sp. 23-1044]
MIKKYAKRLASRIFLNQIKDTKKRDFIHKLLNDEYFYQQIFRQNQSVEKLYFYAHNYLPNPRLVVVWIVGGLGNQMYLYAFGRALEKMGYSVIFDASEYKNSLPLGVLVDSANLDSALDFANGGGGFTKI